MHRVRRSELGRERWANGSLHHLLDVIGLVGAHGGLDVSRFFGTPPRVRASP
jgi:hypothetical protein